MCLVSEVSCKPSSLTRCCYGSWCNRPQAASASMEASGHDVPPAVHTFTWIDLGGALNENIRRCKYVRHIPVQRHTIPIVIGGKDLIVCAQTGSVMTAVFCFPIISGILKSRPPQRPKTRTA